MYQYLFGTLVVAGLLAVMLIGGASDVMALTCSDGQWNERYRNERATNFLTTETKLERCTGALNYDWGAGSPGGLISSDDFTLSARTTQIFDSGTYEFSATTDDGMRVIVDGAT